MTDSEPPHKIYVNAANQVSIICPKCNFAKLVELQAIANTRRVIKLVCRCKHSFKVQLEFRQYARKMAKLTGTFTANRNRLEKLPVKIVNLSRGGACFECNYLQGLKIGDKGTLIFTLDDKPRTVVEKEIIIKFIDSSRIGCEFVQDQEYDKALGFYVSF